MRAALALARRGLGSVAPNPAVGCVVVRDGAVVGRGWTQPGGRPHAETEALARAGDGARGSTAYVTLEPCSHHGRTPPCADALVAAGIARAVVATGDPDPRVSGAGLARLRAAGIAVDEGVLKAEADALNAGFFLRVREGRPLVTLKLATSLDGRIATPSGESRWITGEAARARAHLLRAEHDAILVGSGTALADDPMLDIRLAGFEAARRLRVVLDGRSRLPATSRLAASARSHPVLLVTRPQADASVLAACGVEIARTDGSPRAVLALLADRGITRLLVEGGGAVAAAFLRSGLVDRVVRFGAGKVLGGDGVPAVGALGLARLADVPAYVLQAQETCGDDVLETWARAT